MAFEVAPQVQAFLGELREFLQTRVFPLEADLLAGRYTELGVQVAQVREDVKRRGWWAPHLPKADGGMGLPLMQFARVSEQLGRSPVGHWVFNCQAPDAGNQELLLAHASPGQRARFLTPLLAGEVRSCFAMTEPERAGSNPVWLATRAVLDGDAWVLDGHKWFTTGADGAAFAVVMAVTEATEGPDAPPAHQRASLFLVPTDTPGFRIVRNLPVMGEAGAGPFSHAELQLDGCRVPSGSLLGARGAGFQLAQARLGPGRIHHCMRWIGIAERALGLMVERARTRELSPGEPLGTKQQVEFWIAESRAEIDAMRLSVLDAAERIDRAGARAARVAISSIKFLVPQVMLRVIDRAIQVHGGLGMTDDLLLAFWYRHERGSRIYDGPDEVHKAVVAREEMRKAGGELPRPPVPAPTPPSYPPFPSGGGVSDSRSGSQMLAQSSRPPVALKPVAKSAGDELREPRLEAALDLTRLRAYLRARAPALPDIVRVQQFISGWSNLTYLLETNHGALVLRRAPPGVAIASAHDMTREFRTLVAVRSVFPKVPRPIVLCEDASVLGTPFYVMERLEGVILRGAEPRGIPPNPAAMRHAAFLLVDTLAELHSIDVSAGPVADLGNPEGYVARQVQGWRGRWEKARSEPVLEMEEVGQWLGDHVPVSSPPALLHNDYKFDNIVFDPSLANIVGVLDWEMATLGDPLADLGLALAVWTEAGDPPEMRAVQLGPTALPGCPTRAEVVQRYAQVSGEPVDNMGFYLSLGLFKFAVIVQQLAARAKSGASSDARFQNLEPVVGAYARAAANVAKTGTLSFQ